MAHKIVELKRGFSYTYTDVPFSKSLGQIQDMLEKHHCEKMASMLEKKGDLPLHTLAFQKNGQQFMIEFPITYLKQVKGNKLDMRISGRIIHDRVKSILVDVELNYLDFARAMMQYLVLPGPNGPMTLMDYTAEHLNEIPQGRFEFRYALPEGRDP